MPTAASKASLTTTGDATGARCSCTLGDSGRAARSSLPHGIGDTGAVTNRVSPADRKLPGARPGELCEPCVLTHVCAHRPVPNA